MNAIMAKANAARPVAWRRLPRRTMNNIPETMAAVKNCDTL
jgi:hypothetical protein